MVIETPRQAGLAVSEARLSIGMTQEQVARQAGVSRQLVNKLEMGIATGISLSKLLAILGVCGCTLSIDRSGKVGEQPLVRTSDQDSQQDSHSYDPMGLYPLDMSLFQRRDEGTGE